MTQTLTVEAITSQNQERLTDEQRQEKVEHFRIEIQAYEKYISKAECEIRSLQRREKKVNETLDFYREKLAAFRRFENLFSNNLRD